MRCPIENHESADLLLAYTARTLSAETTAALDRHIAACPACREFAAGQKAVWEALDAWEAVPVSADFDRRLYQRIEREVSWWDLLVRPFRPITLVRGLPIAAAAGILIMAGIMLQRPAEMTPAESGVQLEAMQTVQPEQVEHALADMELLGEFSREIGR
jgi:anti-sigma factor RsiW